MKNLRCFEVVAVPSTDHNGFRVSIRDKRFNKRRIIPFDYECNHIGDVADNWLKSKGIECLYKAEFNNNSYVMLTDNFEIQIN